MTLFEVIDYVNKEKPNKVSNKHKIIWLNECESWVQSLLGMPIGEWLTYSEEDLNNKDSGITLLAENDEEQNPNPETPEEPFVDYSPILIVNPPYDILYVYWLKAKIDYANEEYESYANNQAQFTSMFDDFKKFAFRSGLVVKSADLPKKLKNVW